MLLLYFYDSKEPQIPQKPALFFLKKTAHNFEKENKLKNAEILLWLMGLEPIHLS